MEEYAIPGVPLNCRYMPVKIAIDVARDVVFAAK